jgi:hypothetical protein
MTAAYWAQWSSAEILSMHGIERDSHEYNDNDDIDNVEEDNEDFFDDSYLHCKMCCGRGCNSCL